jgi:4-amino-4-deoxy-L-arabinose transferase-like glycosyltransferase
VTPPPIMAGMETITTAAPAPAAVPRVRTGKAVWLVAAVAFAVEMAVSARYGYVRDELYFLASGRHLALGGVDQPELTPLLARLDTIVTGNTLAGLRALPALAFAAMIVLTASMARTLGADRRGQLVAAAATACCAEYLGAMHELTTTVPDFFCWTVALLLVSRLLTSRDPRWWVAIGGAAGMGLAAKWNIGFLLAGLLLGFACTPGARPLLRSRYLAAGALLAAVLAAPDFVWQAAHGWPNFAVFHALQQDAWSNRANYWPGQILYTSIVLVPLWVRGAAWSLRSARYRPVGIAAVAVICAQFVLGGKTYYPGGIYTFLFAAGAVAITTGAGTGRPLRRLVAVYCVAVAVVAPISLPVLPAAALARFPVQKINYDLGEEIGWPSEVQLVADTWQALPPAQRARTTLLAGNYGEAGAVERYGPSLGLPAVYSGANNFWLWGPPPAADTAAVAIGVSPSLLRREFTRVVQVAVWNNGLGVADDEQGTPVYLATGLRGGWAAAWPAFRDFS